MVVTDARMKNMDVDEEEDNVSSSIIFQEGSKLTIEQIELDRDDYVKQIRELAQDNNVFIMYNAWSTFVGWYERLDKDLAEPGDYNRYWRIRPFKEYYERNRDKPCFEEAIYFRTIHNEQSLIRMT